MTTIRITTQAELDAALARTDLNRADYELIIDSPRGVWLEITDSRNLDVRAYDSATVHAGSFVAVHLHSARVTLDGGHVIDVTQLDLTDPQTWCDYTGATITPDQKVELYKAVDATLTARPTTYPIGEQVTAPDWREDHTCGGGLHASPHPHQSLYYAESATRMLLVTVPLADLRPIPGDVAKAKAQTVTVVREVALDGTELATQPAEAVGR